MRTAVLILALCWTGWTAATPVLAAEAEVFGTIGNFVWKEFGDNGTRLLTESGTLAGVGASYRTDLPDEMLLHGSAEIFGGAVGYEGETQSGLPTTSTVDYLGLKVTADAGKRVSLSEPFTLEPFAGLGLRSWVRRIRNGTTTVAPLAEVQGYMEQWTTLYARLGTRGGTDLSPTCSFFAEAGLKLPLYNQNIAYLSREGIAGDVTMHPGWEWSYFAEAGIKRDRLKVSVFYDGMRFSRSAGVTTVTNVCSSPTQGGKCLAIFYQPKSTADIYGLNVGYAF